MSTFLDAAVDVGLGLVADALAKDDEPKTVEQLEESVTESKVEALTLEEVKDTDWVCSCFAVPKESSFDYEMEKRYFTNATRKVGGSGLGEGRVINMPPGINEFCDIPMGMGIDGTYDGTGPGVFYSEGLDDQLDIIHIRPGIPRHSSLGRFYENAVQADAVNVNEYGWFDKAVNAVASATGALLTLPFKIVATPFNVLARLASGDDTNRYSYYYLAPATHLYWKTLDNIVNDFAIRSGVIPGASFADSFDDGSSATKVMRPEDVDYFIQNIPGVYRAGKFGVPRIDVLAISTRYQVMKSAREEYLQKKLNELGGAEVDEEFLAAWEDVVRNHNPWGEDESTRSLAGVQRVGEALDGAGAAMYANYDKIVNSNLPEIIDRQHQMMTVSADEDGNIDASISLGTDSGTEPRKLAPEMDDTGFVENMKVVASAGAEWISFAVDHISESTVTINNSSGPSGLEGVINGMVSSMRGVNFNLAGGNIGDGFGSQLVEGLLKTGSAAVSGLTNSFVGAMPSAILGGKAYIDIPDVYQESTMEFNQTAYSITSVATSGHPLAKLRMLMPYFALLALASPRSGGPSSYTPPFLVEVQHKGRSIVQLGLIDSLAAKFGEVDGWDVNDIPNQVTIDFSVTNLNKGFHVPVDPDAAFTYRDTGEFSMHMSVLAGTSLTDRDRAILYNMKRSAMRLSQRLDRFTSATYWGHMTGSAIRSMDIFGVLPAMGYYTNRRG